MHIQHLLSRLFPDKQKPTYPEIWQIIIGHWTTTKRQKSQQYFLFFHLRLRGYPSFLMKQVNKQRWTLESGWREGGRVLYELRASDCWSQSIFIHRQPSKTASKQFISPTLPCITRLIENSKGQKGILIRIQSANSAQLQEWKVSKFPCIPQKFMYINHE